MLKEKNNNLKVNNIMKQLKKTLLTLVALFAMTAGATAQTGYNGAALPAGPDMSGSVINVTAANAQYVLDGAYGDITGKTINFTENVTSLLDLARPTKYAGSGTTVSGTTYTRTLSNVTFTANSGVTLAGFYCTAGATDWSVNKDVMYLNNVYNYVTDGNGNYTRIKNVSNVTFDGLTINAPSGTLSAVFAFGKPGYLTMDGITFTNCTITNSNGHGLYFCSLDQDCMQYGAISITNSIIQGTASNRSGVIIEGVGYSNTVITNNYIVGNHNAIQIENPGNGGSQPQSVTITGNFLKSNNKYPVNLYQLTSNMFTFTGNVVVAGASGQHVGHFHGNASGNLWAANGSAPDANGRITTTLTAPALYGNDNDVTSTSYYSTAVVNTSSDIWVKFDVTGVTLSQTEASLTVGNTVRLTPTLAPEGQTDQTVTWATSDAAVATVSNEGVVTAVGAGTATITVTATNGTDVTTDDQTATCTVTVAGTPVAIDWTEATKTASIASMPAGNVTVSVDYFAQAELAMSTGETPVALAPAAIADVPANTDAPIVKAGTVANIGTSDDKQGTLMYFVSQPTGNTVPDAPDYDTKGWSDKVPTADGLAQGKAFVWYYIKGAEPANIADRTDDNTRSDSDIKPLGSNGFVTLAAEPTYDVTLNAEGLSDEEAAAWKVAKGTDDPAAFPLEGVKKGDKVTVTYSGSKKVLGVKAEKKSAEKTIKIGDQDYTVQKGETWKQFITRNQLSTWSFLPCSDTTWSVIMDAMVPPLMLYASTDGTNWGVLELTSQDAPIDTDKQYNWGQ